MAFHQSGQPYLVFSHKFNKNFNGKIKWCRILHKESEYKLNFSSHRYSIFKKQVYENWITCNELNTKLRSGWAANVPGEISEKQPALT